jgi:serine/threonine protein kinase, bacterial
MVVAPLGTAVATAAVVQPGKPSPLVGSAQGFTGWIWTQTTALLRKLLVLLLLLGAGGLGWAAVRAWLQPQSPQPSATSSAQVSTAPPATPTYSTAEKQRKAQMISRLEGLGVSSGFFYRLANEAYFLKYPDQQGRLLSNGPEDEALRANWDQVGSQVLDAMQPLRPGARDRLGSYTEADRSALTTQLRASGKNPGQFFEQAESRLTDALPMYRGVDLRGKIAFQLASGIAADQLVEADRR